MWSHSGVPHPWHRCGCVAHGVTALSSEPEQPQPLRKISFALGVWLQEPHLSRVFSGEGALCLGMSHQCPRISRGISLVISAAKLVTVGA